MPTLIIRDVPKDLHARLKQQAVENHRSTAKEALAVLEGRLGPRPLPRWDLAADLPRIRPGKKHVDPVKIVRRMRESQ